MKITYDDSCFYQTIDWSDHVIYSSYSDKKKESPNIAESKNLALILIDRLKRKDLEYSYIHEISHDYENKIIKDSEELKKELKEHVKNLKLSTEDHTWYTFFCFLSDIVSALGKEIYSDSCEECGDYNQTVEYVLNLPMEDS